MGTFSLMHFPLYTHRLICRPHNFFKRIKYNCWNTRMDSPTVKNTPNFLIFLSYYAAAMIDFHLSKQQPVSSCSTKLFLHEPKVVHFVTAESFVWAHSARGSQSGKTQVDEKQEWLVCKTEMLPSSLSKRVGDLQVRIEHETLDTILCSLDGPKILLHAFENYQNRTKEQWFFPTWVAESSVHLITMIACVELAMKLTLLCSMMRHSLFLELKA